MKLVEAEAERVPRFRLRFHLREVDLKRSVTCIGRGEDCDVSFEDSLVSRRHARIVLRGDAAVIEDLGSRNGVLVNGRRIDRPERLVDGDRVRIGAQDLVFCCIRRRRDRWSKTTGVLRGCGQCNATYPREVISCPTCGAVESMDEPTLSGALEAASH
jgi:pSer/pThr/pTyr-binding forkhead associated (FHA) protein